MKQPTIVPLFKDFKVNESETNNIDVNSVKEFAIFLNAHSDKIQKMYDENDYVETARKGIKPNLGLFVYGIFKNYNK